MESDAATDGSPGKYWSLFALAALSFAVLPFSVQYTGEEAAYTLQAYEQWYHQSWLSPTLLGVAYPRPPLFAWLIAALSALFGWPHMLAAARTVSALATIGSGILVMGFARRTGSGPARSAYTGLVYLTLWEPLFYYGWLAYSDALFGALVLAGMLAAWLAVRERRPAWLALALLMAFAGFLTKALTAYVFVGLAWLVALWRERPDGWRPGLGELLLSPLALLPLAWYAVAPTGDNMASGMAADIGGKLVASGAGLWLRHLLTYPAQTALNLLPAAGVVLWQWWRQRQTARARDALGATAAWMALLNFLPYWLAPQSSLRYLMPLYGLLALPLAGRLWHDPHWRAIALRWMFGAIVLKWIAALWLFPAYTTRVRPDIAAIAADVRQRSTGHVLYVDSTSWMATAVAATLDAAPRTDGTGIPPLVHSPANWNAGFALLEPSQAAPGDRVVARFEGLWLICRGGVCP